MNNACGGARAGMISTIADPQGVIEDHDLCGTRSIPHEPLDLRVINRAHFAVVVKIPHGRSVSREDKSRSVERQIARAIASVPNPDRESGETARTGRHAVFWRQVVGDGCLVGVLKITDSADHESARLGGGLDSWSKGCGSG